MGYSANIPRDSNRVEKWPHASASCWSSVTLRGRDVPHHSVSSAPVLSYDRIIQDAVQGHMDRIKAVEDQLERIRELVSAFAPEVIELRDISPEQAKKEIKQYFEEKHGEHFDSVDIMSALSIDHEIVDRVLIELEKEGSIAGI